MSPAAEVTANVWYYGKLLEFVMESRFLHFAKVTQILILKKKCDQKLKTASNFP